MMFPKAPTLALCSFPFICLLWVTSVANAIDYHLYADDAQVYHLKTGDESNLHQLLPYLWHIKCWMTQNFLQVNGIFF